MTDSYPLPFDALRPFKSKPEEFVPRDNLPWEQIAVNLVKSGNLDSGFVGLRSKKLVEQDVKWLLAELSLPPQATILDIGCGPGLYCHRLAQFGHLTTGIDIADSFLSYARNKAQEENLSCTFLNLSMFELNFSAQFDVILLIQSLANRITTEQLHDLLDRVQRALKPGGHLIAEFSLAPTEFSTTEPISKESLFLLNDSPWSHRFHAYMVRDLIFPSTKQRVTHHLIVEAQGRSQEYWSHFTLHSRSDLKRLLSTHGLSIKQMFGPKMGKAIQEEYDYSFIWAVKEST